MKVFSSKFGGMVPFARQKQAICESFSTKSYFSPIPSKFPVKRYAVSEDHLKYIIENLMFLHVHSDVGIDRTLYIYRRFSLRN